MPENAQYIVSARKYRPDSFEDLIGQDNIVRTLKNSISRGKLAHAYLFCGPRGVGKTSAARIFAKTINCASPTPDMEPCGHCESCISFQEGRSYCIHELDAASNNGVDDIKALMDQVQIPPQVGKYSVYIIDEVHMLTQSAFNAFLKTLEEPPAHAIFILATTEKHKILPTILSRCQTYDFNRISIRDIVDNLRNIAVKENINIDDESLHVIARKADGAMRDALTIFDQTVAFCGTDVKYEDVVRNLNVLDYEHCFHLTEAMLSNDYATALMEFDGILSRGFNALYFVSSLSEHFRNLMVARTGALDALLEFPDSLKNKYAEQASRCTLQFLYDALAITSQCESGYKESVNPRLHIEFALMKLCFLVPCDQVNIHQTGASAAAARPATLRPNATPAVDAASATPTAGNSRPESSAGPNASAPGTSRQPAANPAPGTSQQPAANPAPGSSQQPVAAPGTSQQSAAQSPSPQARPSAAPSRPRRTARAAALSLDAIKEEAKTAATSVMSDSLTDRIPENEEIMQYWKQLPDEYKSRPRLYTMLSTTKVETSVQDGYKLMTFYVLNPSQKTWVEQELLRELEAKMQKSLQTSKLRLSVEVTPEETVEKKIYMPADKAKVLISENEEVKNLVKDFDLDVK